MHNNARATRAFCLKIWFVITTETIGHDVCQREHNYDIRLRVRCFGMKYAARVRVAFSMRGRDFFFLQTRIAIPQYFSQSYGAYFKYIVRTCTCAYTYYCKCLRDVNDILRHIKIRAIWLAEMQSSFAEKKNRCAASIHIVAPSNFWPLFEMFIIIIVYIQMLQHN